MNQIVLVDSENRQELRGIYYASLAPCEGDIVENGDKTYIVVYVRHKVKRDELFCIYVGVKTVPNQWSIES